MKFGSVSLSMTCHCLLAACAMFSSVLSAQTGVIRGVVSDSRGPLDQCSVQMSGDAKGGASDIKDGRFAFPKLAAGEYSLTAACLGSAPVTQHVRLKEGQDLTTEILVESPAVVSGRVVDEHEKPMP